MRVIAPDCRCLESSDSKLFGLNVHSCSIATRARSFAYPKFAHAHKCVSVGRSAATRAAALLFSIAETLRSVRDASLREACLRHQGERYRTMDW
jgi:hypothetical protein